MTPLTTCLSKVAYNFPDFYDAIFSDELISILANNVLMGCKNIALISYNEQLMKFKLSVSKVINDAWDYIRRYPEDLANEKKHKLNYDSLSEICPKNKKSLDKSRL